MNIKNNSFLKKSSQIKINRRIIYFIVSIIMIAIVVAINIVANILTDKYSLKVDLTSNKVFSLTEDSINYISSLNKDVEIIILNSKDKFLANGDYYIQSDAVINEYANYSDRISVTYVDPDENPGVKTQYSNEDVDINSIIVKSGDKHKVLSAYNIFNIQSSYSGHSIMSSKAEQSMTSAIMNVTSDHKVEINLITGFDEIEPTDFINFLNTNNYEVNPLSMLTSDFNDTPVSVICAPNRDYDDQSIDKIKNYLYNEGNYGRNLIYFVNPGQIILPKIESFFKEWGIGINDGLVFETEEEKMLMKKPFNAICEYEDSSEYSDLIKNKSIPVCMPISRPLESLDDGKVTKLLKFSETAGIMPSNASDNWMPSKQDIKGPISCMLVSTNKNDDTGAKSTVTVVGSAAAIDGSLISKSSLNNSEYFLNFFNGLTERSDFINIEPKSMGVQELLINPIQEIVIGIVFALALPILILIVGIAVWFVRRKR